jgi:hypothetical protein
MSTGSALTIGVAFDQDTDNGTGFLYTEAVRRTLPKLLSPQLLNDLSLQGLRQEERHKRFNQELPILTCSAVQSVPFNRSFFVLCRYRPNAFKFFFEMISRWLVPGKRLNVVLIYASDFRIEELGADLYTLCEVMIRLEHQDELDAVTHHLPIVESEIKLGVQSAYYARKILEVRGLSADEKTAQIQAHIAHLVKRLPKIFDADVFTEMQHHLVICRDEFKDERSVRHLSRLISIHYVFRKLLNEALRNAPNRRHVLLKLMQAHIHTAQGRKRVLGILVGISFLKDKEVFEERHLLMALQNHLSVVQLVPGSYTGIRRGSEQVRTLYLEIVKSDGSDFTAAEMAFLTRTLPEDLKGRIEHPMHPLFNPRNEEEIMRNVVALTKQLKSSRDLPQVYISFDEQSYTHLYFIVIFVRVLKEGDPSIEPLFRMKNSRCEYIHDKCRPVGFTRKKHPKEATIFRLKLDKESFLRQDHSIDLCQARDCVVRELEQVVGEVRDYNGGMISKQSRLLNGLRQLVQQDKKVDSFLLDNYFYSLHPVIMRSVMEPAALKTLYLLMLAVVEKGIPRTERARIAFREDAEFLYAGVITEDKSLSEAINEAIRDLRIATTSLATAHISPAEALCIGFVYRCDNAARRHAFCSALQTFAGAHV